MTLEEFLFPTKFTCLACDEEIKEGALFCEKCRKDFVVIDAKKACKRCGQPIFAEGDYCLDCKNKELSFKRNYAVFPYRSGVKTLIRRFKFGGGKYLADYLANKLAEKLEDIEEKIDYITFVPMTKSDERARGYNQSKVLAEKLSDLSGIEVIDVAQKVKRTKQQVGLGFKDRQNNLKGCFKATARIDGKTVLVIDDVMTTGATLSELAKVLKKAGAGEVITETVAVNMRQSP